MISRAQLLACGVSSSAVSRWVACGRLVRLYPSVYAVGHRALTIRGQLVGALLYAAPGAALSHTTGAWWWELVAQEPRVIHVSAPVRRLDLDGVRVHRPRDVEREVRDGLPVTPVARTLLDLAAMLPFEDLRRALAEADYRNRLDPAAARALCRPGQPGSRALRRALDIHLPRLADTLSVLEERFFALCEDAGLPLPEVNVFVARLKVDALWRAQRLIVELDGHEAHCYAAAAERDRGRELVLRAAGYSVRRYTWRQVTEQAEIVIGDLRAGLA